MLATGILAFSLSIMSAPGQEASRPNAVDAIVDCRQIQDPTARLNCYDKAAAALVTARDNEDLVVLDRAEVQTTRRSLFGFSLPRIRLFGGSGDDGHNPEDIQEISGTVTNVVEVSRDRFTVTLDDKSRWVTTESARGFAPRAGESVVIRRAMLGSYDARFNKRRAIKVRRTQ